MTVVANVEDNRVQLLFPAKPSEKVRRELKRHGFRWARSAGAWQRQLIGCRVTGAIALAERLNEMRDE